MSENPTPQDPRPDLDESLNVSEAHAAVQASEATQREKYVRENGMEPVTLGLVVISAFIVLLAGAVMGQGGGFFGYKEFVKAGYVRGASPVPEETAILPVPALAFFQKEGAKAYATCSGCHQSDGAGQSGVIPPLAGSEWVTGNTEKLLLIVHNGVQGPIEVAGNSYAGQMAAIGGNLGAKEMAALLTYIRTSWGNDGSIVTPEMAAAGLEISKQRGGAITTAEELLSKHNQMLPGEPIDPNALIDPETWEPVGPSAQ